MEKPDVIGAVFGQTEGLLGSDLNLRELQKTGRIGRIEVNIKSKKGSSEGDIIIPSALDSAETSLIAATLETIERIGPCNAKFKLESVEDVRIDKRKYVIDKAKDILRELTERGVPDSEEISEEIKKAVRTDEISKYGDLPCGPNLLDSESMIIVEGRADVLNLLKHGVRNVISIEGTSVPQPVIKLSKEKVSTAFVDGDRGGKLILKELTQVADLEYIAVAPEGKEVEELSQKEIFKSLREKTEAKKFDIEGMKVIKTERRPERPRQERTPQRTERKPGYGRGRRDSRAGDRRVRSSYSSRVSVPRLKAEQREFFRKTLEELVGTRAACIFNSNNELLGRVPVSELENTIKTLDNPHTVILDDKVNPRLSSIARRSGVKFLVGMDKDASVRGAFSRKELG